MPEEELTKQLAEEIDKAMLGEFIGKILSDKKADVDPEYLHNIKLKVEKILLKIITHYGLQDYMSEKFRYRLDSEKLCTSKYYTLYKNKQDINGKALKYGYTLVPETFTDWLDMYLNDYTQTETIYMFMCTSRRIKKDDLIYLNKMARKYGAAPDE